MSNGPSSRASLSPGSAGLQVWSVTGSLLDPSRADCNGHGRVFSSISCKLVGPLCSFATGFHQAHFCRRKVMNEEITMVPGCDGLPLHTYVWSGSDAGSSTWVTQGGHF